MPSLSTRTAAIISFCGESGIISGRALKAVLCRAAPERCF